jgi:uncharacterized small protein (TIGR04563 family)
MGSTEKQKQSLYFPDDMMREIMAESTRLDRSLSWTVQQAWRLARAEVQKLPAAPAQRAPACGPARRPDEERGGAGEPRPSPQVLEFLKGKFEHDATT